jgi:hypothetical protein
MTGSESKHCVIFDALAATSTCLILQAGVGPKWILSLSAQGQ